MRSTGAFQGRFGSDDPTAHVHEGSVDVGELIRENPPSRILRRDRVAVRYHPDRRALARTVADLVQAVYGRVEERLGLRVGFDAEILLCPVDEMPRVFHHAARSGPAVWPILVPRNLSDPWRILEQNLFPYTFVHEVVEATLVTGAGGHNPILNDVKFGIVVPLWTLESGTRWFREGVANYAGLVALDLVEERAGRFLRFAHPRPLRWLERLGGTVLAWSQDDGGMLPGNRSEDYYSGALGLILAISARVGSDRWIRGVLRAVDRMEYADGEALRRAVRLATGIDPLAFTRSYRLPRPGFRGDLVHVPRLAGPAPSVEGASTVGRARYQRAVQVDRVSPGSPADRADLRPGDLVLRADGRELRSIEDLHAVLDRAGPGGRLELEVMTFEGGRRTVGLRLDP